MYQLRISTFSLLIFIASLLIPGAAALGQDSDLRNLKILLYTKNGEGYVHKNIPTAVKAIQELGEKHGFEVMATEDPEVFTESNLRQYDILFFASTNNDVFENDRQRLAFRRYIQSGGGFVGLHSVVGTERKWEWFKQLLGGSFVWHPRLQEYNLKVIDPEHPTVRGIPTVWKKVDECYFMKELYPGIKVTIAHDLESLNPEQKDKIQEFAAPFSKLYPAVWHHAFDGGEIWISALGHDERDYGDPVFMQHLLQGIEYIASRIGTLDPSRAYATSRDSPVRYTLD